MKYLLFIALAITLVAWKDPQPNRLVAYLNDITLATPGWDKNTATIRVLDDTLRARFWRDIEIKKLVDGIPFTLTKINKEMNGHLTAIFEIYDLALYDTGKNVADSMLLTIKIFSTIPQSMADTLSINNKYYLTGYARAYARSLATAYPSTPVITRNNLHLIQRCDLAENLVKVTAVKRAD